MAEHFARAGHDVLVATTFPHYPSWRRMDRRIRAVEARNGVEIRRWAAYVPSRQSALQRGVYEVSLFGAGLASLPLRSQVDVVVGFVPSLAGGLLARTAARALGCPYGLIVHDLMGLAASQSGVAGGSGVTSVVTKMELSLARGAKGVAVIAEGFQRYFELHGVPRERLHRVRTWTQRTNPVEPRAATRRRLNWTDQETVCLHAGNIGHKQGLDNLLDTAHLLEGSGVRLVLMGDGNERSRLEQRARFMHLQNLSFAPGEPAGRFESVLQAADILLVNQRRSVGDMSLPSKLTSYLPVGRPVVAAVASGSETCREIQAAGAGLVVPPDDPASLAAALRTLQKDRELGDTYGNSGRMYAHEVLRPSSVLKSYDDFLKALIR